MSSGHWDGYAWGVRSGLAGRTSTRSGLTPSCQLNCEHRINSTVSDLTPRSELALCLQVDLSIGSGGAPSAGTR